MSTSIIASASRAGKWSRKEKARRFSVVAVDLPIVYVLEALVPRHRPEGYVMHPGDRLPIRRFLTIRHDQERAAEPGTHVLIETVNPIRLETVAGWFDRYRVQVKAVKGSTTGNQRSAWARAVRYMTHENTPDKTIYPDSAVHASKGWDWRAEVEWLEGREKGLPSLLERVERRVMDRELSRWDVREQYRQLYTRKGPRYWAMLESDAEEHHAYVHRHCIADFACVISGGERCDGR